MIGAHSAFGSDRDCPLDRGMWQCQDASGKEGRGLQPVNTYLPPGALGATAVRSGLYRRTADAHAFLTMSIFIHWL